MRFRLFPQAPVLPAFSVPETVEVSGAPGSIGAGPSDERIYVVDPVLKLRPYEYPYLPPFVGPVHPPALPGSDGHFDHLKVGTRAFNAAHMFGTLRFVLDIWEGYFGRRIDWHFAEDYPRLELIPHIEWDNAQSGYGFIETGYGFDEDYGEHPFCLNFDILAHELGHSLLFSIVGTVGPDRVSAEYLGFQEAASDIVTLLSTLHFPSVVDYVLSQTKGNIYAPNELNRFAELSPISQIRSASNFLRMSDVPDISAPARLLSEPNRHLIGQPLTGAVFDLLVELFQTILAERGLISAELDAMSRRTEEGVDESTEVRIQRLFDEAFEGNHDAFVAALVDSRDIVGSLCGVALAVMTPNLTYGEVAGAFLEADRDLTGGELSPLIAECFNWRQIPVRPLRPRRMTGGLFSQPSLVARKIW